MNYFFLSRAELFYRILEEEIKEVLTCLKAYEKNYKKKDIIYRAGTYVKEIGFVEEGSVNIVEYDYWGNKSIIGNIKKGDIFSLSYAAIPSKKMQADVVANEDCTILFLNIENLINMCPKNCHYHNGIIHNLFRISANKTINILQRMKHISSKTIRGKLISYLSQQALDKGKADFTIIFNRQQLSEYLGVDRSALSNELSKMQKDGLLTYKGKNFTLKDSFYEN